MISPRSSLEVIFQTNINSQPRIAQSFTALITSLVSSVLLPPLSLLPFLNKNLDEKFAVLRPGPHYGGTLHNHTEVGNGVDEGVANGTMVEQMGIEFLYGAGYNTLKQALDDGAVVLAWGYAVPFSSLFYLRNISLDINVNLFLFFIHVYLLSKILTLRQILPKQRHKFHRCRTLPLWYSRSLPIFQPRQRYHQTYRSM